MVQKPLTFFGFNKIELQETTPKQSFILSSLFQITSHFSLLFDIYTRDYLVNQVKLVLGSSVGEILGVINNTARPQLALSLLMDAAFP